MRDLEKTPVRPLVASRLSFPTRAATFRLADYLHGDTRAAFLDPALLLKEDAGAAPRCAPVRAKGGEWEKYLHMVDDAGGMELLIDAEVPRDVEGVPCPAGFFPITKDANQDRTITNRIPRNSQERQLGLAKWLLAHGCCFCDLDLGQGLVALISMRDLPDCFHSVRSSPARTRTNAVGPVVAVADFAARGERGRGPRSPALRRLMARCRALGVSVPTHAQPAWRTLPMGDLNAVDFVQVGHLNLLRRGGVLPDGQLVRYAAPLPPHGSGSVLAGIVVDDVGVVGIVPRDAALEPGPDTECVQRAMSAYAAAGLFPKESKSVDRRLVHDIWGATLDGGVGVVSASVGLLVRLATFLLALTLDGRATAGTLRAVLGLCVYACMYRRPAFALLSAVFHVVIAWEKEDALRPSGGGAGRSGPAGVRPLPPGARVELELLLAFLPLLSTDLRSPPGERLWATDASSRSAAAVSTLVHPDSARQFWRHRARRGAKSSDDMLLSLAGQLLRRFGEEAERGDEVACEVQRLLGLETGGNDQSSESPAEQPPTWTAAVAEASGWKSEFRYNCPRAEHINFKEARPIRTLIRHLAKEPADQGKRHFTLVDSSVNVGAWAKGRSRAVPLNHIMRSCVPDQVMTDTLLGIGHVRSAFNPADNPTRGRPVRSVPVREPSGEIAALLRGEFVENVFGPGPRPLPEAVEPFAAHV